MDILYNHYKNDIYTMILTSDCLTLYINKDYIYIRDPQTLYLRGYPHLPYLLKQLTQNKTFDILVLTNDVNKFTNTNIIAKYATNTIPPKDYKKVNFDLNSLIDFPNL